MKQLFSIAPLLCIFNLVIAQNAVTPGNIRIDPTFEHIGILYNISGDANLNSSLQIEFREQGNGTYRNGAVTMRSHPGLAIDGSTYNANHHAGSAMFLQPNTTYQIRLTLSDPNGGGTTTTISATTRAYPTESNNFRYVAPGNGGGSGTSANPYLGLQAAADNAQAGITYIVRPGNYTSFNIATNGTANAPITFRSETPLAAIVDGANTSGGVIVLGEFTTDSLQHIIIDGLKIQNGQYGIDAQHTQYITIKNCRIENVTWGIYNRRENGWEHDQYITNNYILGRTAWPVGGTEHRGVDIRGNRNVISFNTIQNFDDGVSTDGAPYGISYSMDIHNNDIQNMADDLIEVDGTVSNTRIYRNRMYNGRAGVSLAPVYGGPCYVFRNEMYNMRDGFSAYKMNRGPSGLVIVHNSSSKVDNGMSSPVGWQNTFMKNNVIIGSRYCFEEFGLVNGSTDDWDYNAYHSTRPGVNTQGQEWFKWNNIRYGNITELQNGTDIETNGLAFSLSTDIQDAQPPTSYATEYTPGDADFRPTSGSNFRNNGIQLDNLNDEYVTDGQPDRGAYEFGKPLPVFGAMIDLPPAQNAVTAGTIKVDPTFEHIGILYNISGDANLNSSLQIEFREQGGGTYKKGAVTMRAHPGLVIDGSIYNANHHAGSAMFLQPNTTYQIRLTLTDPNGGGTTTTISATTRAYPTESNNFRYVAPGNGGGSGTSANPYLGLQAAADNAQAGITYIVRPGNYTSFNIATNGTTNAPITFRSETTHSAIVDGGNASGGVVILGEFSSDSLQHIIIDGLHIRNGQYGIDAQHTQYITIKNCKIDDVNWGIYNRRENGWEHDQYITNNYISGRRAWPTGGTSQRAVDIRGNRNVVSFNTIKDFDDGVSTDGAPYGISYALDIHNNDIQNMVDDFIEVDGTVSNTRIYRNRGYNGRSGVSLAPILGGPCYVFRNELYNMDISAFKMNRGPSGMVIVHNSSSKAENGMSSDGWQNTFIKNNVIIGSKYCFEEYDLVSGSIDDWDYNAYHSTRPGINTPGQEWFKWNNIRFGNITELRNGTNIETNGLAFSLSTDIQDAPPPTSYSIEFSPGDANFQPTSGSVFRNNGIQLDNLNDEYVTDGQPDRGAYEFGKPLPVFGAIFDTQPPNSVNEVAAGSIKVDPTFEHIGILYNISDDANLNSNLQIEFRKQGNGAYKKGAITMRSHPGLVIDGSIYNANHHAGSAMFLLPNTTYDIRLTLTDPDGGGITTTIQATTKAYPTESNNYRYVEPGNGGGNGTSSNPYKGLQTAADNAVPGTTYVVRPGSYSSFNIATNGTANAPITFRSETQHAAIVDGNNSSGGIIILGDFTTDSLQHIIIDGFKIQNGQYGIDAQHTQYITIKNCWINDVEYGFVNRRENAWEHDQYLTNNYIAGNTPWPWLQGGYPPERGIDIRGNRNVVSFNTITNFGDAVSTDGPPYAISFALDIHNNDFRNMGDDLIEVDGTVSNTRVYRNRLYNGRAGISMAPVFGGPCYVFRNEIYNLGEIYSAYKMNRGPSGLVIVHNSSSKIGGGFRSPTGWQNTFVKNNVIIGSRYCFEFEGLVTGSIDDWDYNGYLSTRAGTPGGEEWFKWDNNRYATIQDLRNGTTIEDNGIGTSNLGIINALPPTDETIEYNPDNTKFQPYGSGDLRNSGTILDNLNDEYVSDGMPDIGAYEYSSTLPKFGVDFDCKVAIQLSIELESDRIEIYRPTYHGNYLYISGLRRDYTIEITDGSGNEIESFIDGQNRVISAICPYIKNNHYLIISNKTQPNTVKARFWLYE